jgi:hypothetical protein
MKHSIGNQFRNDVKAARKIWLPWRVLLPYAVLCLAVIIVCDRFGRLSMALPLLNCIAVFGLLIYLKWPLRRQPLFWTIVGVFAALHALLLWYLPWTSNWVPAAAIAGISSVDFCLMLWILIGVEALISREAELHN